MEILSDFLLKRRSVTAKKMCPIQIKDEHLEKILSAGIRVPDHGALAPWKIVVFKDKERETFGKNFLGKRFKELNPDASLKEVLSAADKKTQEFLEKK